MKRRHFLWLASLLGLVPRARAIDTGVFVRATGLKVLTDQLAIGWLVRTSDRAATAIDESTEAKGKNILYPDVLATLTEQEVGQLRQHIGEWFLQRSLSKTK